MFFRINLFIVAGSDFEPRGDWLPNTVFLMRYFWNGKRFTVKNFFDLKFNWTLWEWFSVVT